jgi:hypothetical protein
MNLQDAFLRELTGPSNNLAEVWMAIRNDQNSGDGSRCNPFRANTAVEFDSRISSFPTNCTIRLGPGVFRTGGGAEAGFSHPNPFPLTLKHGQKITGSGMGQTTLMFDWSQYSQYTDAKGQNHYMIFGGFFENGYEVSDLTLDCNLGAQPFEEGLTTYPKFAVGGIALNGNNIRIRRVRFINFGTRTSNLVNGQSVTGNPLNTWEGFVCRIGMQVSDLVFSYCFSFPFSFARLQ